MTIRRAAAFGAIAIVLLGAANAQGGTIIEDFESGIGDWHAWPTASASTITQVPSGTNGIPSSSGGYHAEIFMDGSVHATATANGGAYTYPGGSTQLMPGFGKATYGVDVYIDPAAGGVGEQWNMQVGLGFNNVLSTASSNVTVGDDAFKTFSFVARKIDDDTWTLGRNSGTPSPIEITEAGWFTLTTEWTETPNGIVDYNYIFDGTTLYDVGPGVNVLGTTAESYDLSYMWLFGYDDIDKTVAIDNSTFTLADTVVPEPASLLIWGSSLLGLALYRRRRKSQS